jgi:hypothetical protein
MTVRDTVDRLKQKMAEIRGVRMTLAKLEGEYGAEFKSLMDRLQLPEQFHPIELLEKGLNHSEILKP